MRSLDIWIPGRLPLGINSFRKLNTRAKMTQIREERDKAKMCALKAVREKYRAGQDTWTGPTRIMAEIRTTRVFKDIWMIGGSLKQYQDGICLAVLPLGDGPKTPYVWEIPTQVRVPHRPLEGVLFSITEIEG